MTQLKSLVLYFSPGGNTKKVAEAIARGLESQNADVTLGSLQELEDENLYDYDLVCVGSPSYHFNVPAPMRRYSDKQMSIHNKNGNVIPTAPQRAGKWGATFVTYAGPHTGIDEATPAGDHISQMLRHMGFQVRSEWYTIGEFHEAKFDAFNRTGFLGDIRNRPDQHDLAVAERNAAGLASVLTLEKAALEG